MTTRRKPAHAPSPTFDGSRRDHLALWTLRAMLHHGRWRRMTQYGGLESSLLAAGLTPEAAAAWDPTDGHDALARRLRELEREPLHEGGVLGDNLAALAEHVGLSDVERKLLHLGVLCEVETGLAECFSGAGAQLSSAAASVLGHVLDEDARLIRDALRSDSALASTGLLLYSGVPRAFDAPLRVLDGLAELMLVEHGSPDALLRPFFHDAGPSPLGRDDFEHVASSVDRLVRFLRGAIASGDVGVNVLLHGPAGTGKTELARVLAAELGLGLYAVSAHDDAPTPLRVEGDRLSRHAMCQRALHRRVGARASLVLFDELEDVVPARGLFDLLGIDTPGRSSKGRLNHALESNPVPTLWTSNRIDHIDHAVLRRFSMTLRMDRPPHATRRRIAHARLVGLPTTPTLVDRVAAASNVTPADLERSARVATRVAPIDASEADAIVLDELTTGSALRGESFGGGRNDGAVGAFRLDLLNPDLDLDRLLVGLRQRPQATIGLFGPPGTGKTAFAHHVAALLGRELILRRASDLLSRFVGDTEQRLAEAFHEADRRRAVLLIDEADSFLRDRQRATTSWEVSQVNELLVQLEAFDGLCFLASNRVETFDPAAFRRLDVKVHFAPLRPSQRLDLFTALLAHFDATPNPDATARIDRLTSLTPGDFAAVRRTFDLLGGADAPTLAAALAEEDGRKQDGGAQVGFRRGRGWEVA